MSDVVVTVVGGGGQIPLPPNRQGKYLAFDADNNPVASAGTGADAGLRTDIGAPSGASLIGVAGGGNLQDAIGSLPAVIKRSDAVVLGGFNAADAFVGYDGGSAATGAPRLTLGTNTPSGDDAAILFTRHLTGTGMFRHGLRDESTFNSAGTGAYSSFDTAVSMSGTIHYNHLRGYQARMVYSGTGLLDEMNGFGSSGLAVSAGSVGSLYHFHVANAVITGGATVASQVGVQVDALTGAGSNFAFYAAGNPSYLGGNLQINGTLTGVSSMVGTGQVGGQDLVATGTISSFASGGGVSVSATGVQAYSNSSGTGATLKLNASGGPIVVGSTVLPVYSDNTAAAALPTGTLYRTATGVLMVKY